MDPPDWYRWHVSSIGPARDYKTNWWILAYLKGVAWFFTSNEVRTRDKERNRTYIWVHR